MGQDQSNKQYRDNGSRLGKLELYKNKTYIKQSVIDQVQLTPSKYYSGLFDPI